MKVENKKYCKEGDGKHVTETETVDPPVPNRARAEMKADPVKDENPSLRAGKFLAPTVED